MENFARTYGHTLKHGTHVRMQRAHTCTLPKYCRIVAFHYCTSDPAPLVQEPVQPQRQCSLCCSVAVAIESSALLVLLAKPNNTGDTTPFSSGESKLQRRVRSSDSHGVVTLFGCRAQFGTLQIPSAEQVASTPWRCTSMALRR